MLASLFPKAHARYSCLPILGGVLEELCEWLQSRGYPPDACRRRVAAAALLEQLLRRRGIHSLRDCTASDLGSCVPHPRKWTAHMACALGRSLKQYLDERGELASTPPTATDRLVAAYRTYLGNVRGLALVTVNKHAATIVEFLRFLKYDGRSEGLRALQVAEIDAFLTRSGHRLSRISMQHVTSNLRSFLRFLAAENEAPAGLDAYVESPRCYRGERLPRALPWGTVLELLNSIDRSTPKGRRDYVILLLIATYGLRRSEVAGLSLDDIAWRPRQIRVPRAKIGTPLLLPLTDEVATALLDYLRHGRSDSTHRRLFLRVRVPQVPIEPTAVTDVFDAWAAHAGIRLSHLGGPHCLRHSLAMHLLRQGTSLKSIGDLLGQRFSRGR